MPFAPLAKIAIAARTSRIAILRLAKMVPLVALNCEPQSLHLKMRRLA